MPSKLSQFWQELKRRKVTRTITVYAAAAFVILELVDIISPNLGLPLWTFNLVLILLLVGFVIAVILSWIYDIHPEGGIVKTEPAHKVKPDEMHKSSNSWKIASYVSFVIIVGLIVLNIIPRSGKKEILDKSVAVLPFINDSQDQENEHFINGIMEELLINLQTIKELRVPGRTSTEQYRSNPKPIPEIASEMNVAYILEGSGQRYGDNIRLRVQLVEGATDRHIWADSYEEAIKGPKDIFRIQSEIAKSIAAELQAVITPAEKELIERIPTKNLTAFDFYTRGRNEVWKFWSTGDTPALDRAEDLFNAALEYDASYGEAYSGLAWVYWNKHYWEDYYTDHFLDSALILARKALDYDNQISEAYVIMGNYYREMGQIEEAEEAFNKALQLNPNDWMAYWSKGMMYFHIDHVKYMKNLQRAILYNRGSTLPTNLRAIGSSYANAGFFKKCLHFLNEALKLDGDSILFLQALASNEENRGNYEEAIILNHKILSMDSSNINALSSLAYEYSFIGKFEESVYFYSMWDRNRTELNNPYYGGLQRRGYAYYKIGKVNEAESYFNMQMEYSNTAISLDRLEARNLWPYYNLAGLFAFEGDRIKAYENLKIFNRRNMMPLWMVTLIKDDPMFERIRDEPEFQQIIRDVEAKYQAEHERVRQWLEENDLL